MFAIFFDDTTSSDDTMKAIQEVRDVTDNQCYIAGMSAVVTDTKTMAERRLLLCTCSGCSGMYCTCYIYGFIPCTSILYAKYRYGNCV